MAGGNARYRICQQLAALTCGEELTNKNLNTELFYHVTNNPNGVKPLSHYCIEYALNAQGEDLPDIKFVPALAEDDDRVLIAKDNIKAGTGKLEDFIKDKEQTYLIFTPGTSTKQYLPGGFIWSYQNINVFIHLAGYDTIPEFLTERVFTIVEKVLNVANKGKGLIYDEEGTKKYRVITIDVITDEEDVEHLDQHPLVDAALLLNARYQYIAD